MPGKWQILTIFKELLQGNMVKATCTQRRKDRRVTEEPGDGRHVPEAGPWVLRATLRTRPPRVTVLGKLGDTCDQSVNCSDKVLC